jgi:Uma2 family endonuclease
MDRKLRDYFESNVRLVWFVNPSTRTVAVFHSADRDQATTLCESELLDGGEVLPGLSIAVRELFAGLEPATA